jgi:hypothetical protein
MQKGESGTEVVLRRVERNHGRVDCLQERGAVKEGSCLVSPILLRIG